MGMFTKHKGVAIMIMLIVGGSSVSLSRDLVIVRLP